MLGKICFLLMIFAGAPIAQASLKLDELTRSNPNGNFLFESDPRALVSSIQLVFYTGSAHDPKGKEGIAALAFDSILRGTKGKSRDKFSSDLERLGATIEANTRFDRTEIVLYTISENLERAILLLSEAVLEPALRPKEIEQLQSEHLAKLDQSRSRTTGLLFRAFRKEIYKGTPLAHSPDGTINSVKSIKLQDLRPFLDRHINSQNLLVAVNTNIAEDKVKTWVEKYFTSLRDGKPAPKINVTSSQPKGRHLFILDRPNTTTISTIIGHFSYPSDYDNSVEADVGNFILGGGGMVSRLFDELRNKKGWTYGASSGHYLDAPRRYGSVFTLYTFPATEHFTKAIPKAVEVYEQFTKEGVTVDEFNLAKTSLTNSYAFSFAKASSRMANKIAEFIDGTKFLSVRDYRNRLENLSQAELNKIISESFHSQNIFIAVAGNQKELRKLKDMIPGIQSVTILADPVESL